MIQERTPESPQRVSDIVIELNVQTGSAALRRRRVKPAAADTKLSARELVTAKAQWQTGLYGILTSAAGSWRAARAVQQAEETGSNVESGNAQMTADKEEASLLAKLQQARSLHLTSPAVVSALRKEISVMQDHLGNQGGWLTDFFNYTIDQLAIVYGLNEQNTLNLKRTAHWRLPSLTRLS